MIGPQRVKNTFSGRTLPRAYSFSISYLAAIAAYIFTSNWIKLFQLMQEKTNKDCFSEFYFVSVQKKSKFPDCFGLRCYALVAGNFLYITFNCVL